MTRMKDPYAAGWNAALEMLAAHCDEQRGEWEALQDQFEGREDIEASSYYAGQEDAYWVLELWARSKAKLED